MYCEMLGHDVSFAYIPVLQMASDPNLLNKKVSQQQGLVPAMLSIAGLHCCPCTWPSAIHSPSSRAVRNRQHQALCVRLNSCRVPCC